MDAARAKGLGARPPDLDDDDETAIDAAWDAIPPAVPDDDDDDE